MYAADERNAQEPGDGPCDLYRLVESPEPATAPVQRYWQNRIDILRQVSRCNAQQFSKRRRVEQLASKLQRLDCRVYWKCIGKRRYIGLEE